LNGLDLNVTEMKKQLADLDARVTILEKNKPTYKITGDADLAVLAGHSEGDPHYGIMHDGSLTGYNRASAGGGPVGLSKDLTVLHNLALHVTTTAEEGPKLNATLVVGNVLDTLGRSSATRAQQFPTYANFQDANTDVYFQELNATWNASLVGQGVSAKLGRFGWQAGKYLYQRPAYSSQYYSDQYRDNGDYSIDGVALGFGFGKGALTVLFGRNSNLKSNNGVDFNAVNLGANTAMPGAAATVDTTTGITLNFPIGEVGKLNLAYLLHDSFGSINGTTTSFAPGGAFAGTANRIQTWGADATFKFNNIDFGAAYSKGTWFDNNSSKLDTDNAAWDINAKFNVSSVKLGAGYRRVERNFAALADTGRFGTYWNPRNFEGWNVNASFNPTTDVEVYGKGEFVKGLGAAGFFASPLNTTNDKIDSFLVGVNFKMNVFDVGLSYEDVKFQTAANPVDTRQKWYTLGVGYSMSPNSKLSIKYIYSDANFGGMVTNVPGNGGGTAPSQDGIFRGGLLATQLSIKF
ncbi:MAG: porin, partial [Armatimonadota bacterium]